METKITRHPDVRDYFRFVDAPAATHRDHLGSPDDVVDAYEDGRVVLFESFKPDVDLRWIRSLDFPPTDHHGAKKAKPKAVLVPLEKSTYVKHVLSHFFPGDLKSARRYQEEYRRLTAQVRQFVRYTFPGYKVTDDTGNTWRFTPTENEDLHYDSYGYTESEDHAVRLFLNLDDRPRVWNVSHRAQDFIADRGIDLKLKALSQLHPNLFNGALNAKVLPQAQLPCHRVEFAPGALWLVNSQVVAHQVVYGRKMAAHTYNVDPASMRDPRLAFPRVVRDALARLPA